MIPLTLKDSQTSPFLVIILLPTVSIGCVILDRGYGENYPQMLDLESK